VTQSNPAMPVHLVLGSLPTKMSVTTLADHLVEAARRRQNVIAGNVIT
jgi:hypothetical protein